MLQWGHGVVANMTKARLWKSWLGAVCAVAGALAFPAACNQDMKVAGGDGTNGPGSVSCGTPQEGCPCGTPGEVAECGRIDRRGPDGYVSCELGHRTCGGDNRYGACVGSGELKTTRFVGGSGGGGLHVQALAADAAACGADDPCDPYCVQYADTPLGLPGCTSGATFGVTDAGGLTICPNQDGGASDAGAGGAFIPVWTTSNGNNACPPAANVGGTSCTAATKYTDCGQDFRCESGSCVWNGPQGYYDPAVAGVDLTVGASCDASGTQQVPVCNRGSATVPGGTIIGINLTNSPADGCTAIGAADCSGPVPAAGLKAGECFNIGSCMIPGGKYAVVNAGGRDLLEASPVCHNNAAFAKGSGPPGCDTCAQCNTQLTGKVYDPSGTGNDLPLAGVDVFQSSGPLVPFADGVACDTCEGLRSPSYVRTVTDALGNFTLDGVVPGPNARITVQSGRWRRQITLPTPVAACTTTAPTAGTFRMPRNRTEGDIPKMAIANGDQESLECFVRKMGVDASEITSQAGGGRIQVYRDNGMNVSGATAATNLWASQGSLDQYTAVLLACPGSSGQIHGINATQGGFFAQNAAKGGHVLINHHAADRLFTGGSAPASFSSTISFTHAIGNQPFELLVKTGTPPQQQFFDWMQANDGMMLNGPPLADVPQGAHEMTGASAATTTWLGGKLGNTWNASYSNQDFVGSYSFEMGLTGTTPTVNADCGVPGGHGRVFNNSMHVSPARGTSGTFPANCNLSFSLTEMERALEFHIFQLTACQLGGSTPPPPPNLATNVVYTRDFHGVCPSGDKVVWGPFYWQAVIPPGTSIDFRAATADDQASLPAAPPAPGPTTRAVGTANAIVLPPTWSCDGCPSAPVTVDHHLRTDTPGPNSASKDWLRVFFSFHPIGPIGPIMTGWRQVYDCVPGE